MIQVIEATFENGVFRPDKRLDLPPQSRVRLVVEPLEDETEHALRQQAWAAMEQIWQQSTINSHGQHLTREQLHERR